MSNEVETVSNEFSVTYKPSELKINNFAELKAKVQNFSDQYKDLVATDESLAGAKSAKAELNKLVKAIDTERKRIKKEYNEPYNDFKLNIDDLQTILKQTIDPISEQIANIETQQRNERANKVRELINEMAPEYGINPDTIEIEHEWTNKTMSQTKLIRTLKDGFTALKHQQESLELNKKLVDEHCKTKGIDSSGWLSQIDQDTDIKQLLISIDRAVEDKARKEQQKKNEQEYEDAIRKSQQTKVEDKTVDQETGEIVDEEEAIDDDAPSQWTMAFRVTGDFDKLKLLNDFIIKNNISNEMIEPLKELED
ncbi:hypothetical protein C5L30_000371 [Companilactobacillus farciminis]|uniref:DUF1351 domain-containing protein n=1 Tax=Companilactobacillus farciminis TaxID=1612 RepID=A0A4R5NJ83_9LACO|nr:DUF1351 domain-containing protein [Companilactobacillus farciminis]ATO45992.1 hypothetical protein LF20184_04135 [Companilactobacillus farciminis KCTC 3681 = DSM 20184]KRK61330.1 hypothetical protein FC68_GL001090 [Companilactobacillus farciminis KCTC 3681 = DSM 20184]TDG74655.1 hypothetical protein C5L30_000371 [Companilactobacillus farciminis]WCG36292.1 DUF1351 domain-containing protein [Companilactobacillus farciminis]